MTGQQQHLFDTEPAPWDQDDASDRTIATVVFLSGPDKPLDYLVPDALLGQVEVGRRVRAPLGRGNRTAIGYCVELDNRICGSGKLKALLGLVDQRPLLSPSMMRLTQWMADYYLCPWAQVLEAVVPSGVRAKAGTRQKTFLSVPDHVVAGLSQLKLPAKQARALEYLAASAEPLTAGQIAKACQCTLAPIQSLRKKGLVEAVTRRVRHLDHSEPPVERQENFKLNDDQQRGLDAILSALNSGKHETVLMHGVTGSGKTEVYIQAIEQMIHFGRQAIVLVPEISLTPQTRQRFRSRFDHVAVLHSHLSDAERSWHWERIAAGQVQVVIGARSAIFAPTPHLGLVVLDEEHESSFKQATAPRYHARDVALYRAQTENVPLVLGSATPSLESWYRAESGQYRLIDMPHRISNRPLPEVGIIDLSAEFIHRRSRGAISRPLHRAMDEALKAGGQVILLLNRRGFSTHIQCPACRAVVRCPHCEISLTHHRHGKIALCHYCDYKIAPPEKCPECGFAAVRYSGLGTQRLEAEVRKRFGQYQTLRMDTDTMQKPGSHEKALAAFHSGEVRILLGTQMIAKGLDFPNVTLVGVVNADTGLHFPDFRASERSFQLVTQVAGRTGRGPKGGHVLVQTFSPDHPAIRAAVRHDYAQFAAEELPSRKEVFYPPYGAMIRLVIRGPVEDSTRGFAQHIRQELDDAFKLHGAEVRMLGPATAPIAKLRGKYRLGLNLHSQKADPMREAVRQVTSQLKAPEGIQWIVDVDPIEML